MATPMRITEGWVVANSRASVRTSSAASPVISATLSGWELFGRALLQLLVADRVLVDVVVVDEIFRDDHVHHAQRQGGVGARADLDVPVGSSWRCGSRLDRSPPPWRRAPAPRR